MSLADYVNGAAVGVLMGVSLVYLIGRHEPFARPADAVAAPPQAGSSSVEEAAPLVEASTPGTESPVDEDYCSPACPACVCSVSEEMDVRQLRGMGRGDFCLTHEGRWRVLADSAVDLDEFEHRLRLFVRTPMR